jgi:hypothetical protein
MYSDCWYMARSWCRPDIPTPPQKRERVTALRNCEREARWVLAVVVEVRRLAEEASESIARALKVVKRMYVIKSGVRLPRVVRCVTSFQMCEEF